MSERPLFPARDALVRLAFAVHAELLTHRSVPTRQRLASALAATGDALLTDLGQALDQPGTRGLVTNLALLADTARTLNTEHGWQTPIGPGQDTTLTGLVVGGILRRELHVLRPPDGTPLARWVDAIAGAAQRDHVSAQARRDNLAAPLLPRAGQDETNRGHRISPADVTYLALLDHARKATGQDLAAATQNQELAIVADAAGFPAQAYRLPSKHDTRRERVDTAELRREAEHRRSRKAARAPRVHTSQGAGW